MNWIQRKKPLKRSGISNKYGAKKSVDTSGRSFDSGLERSVFALLELERRAGLIKEIRQQASVYLTDARILYKPDFEVISSTDETYWVEAKGFSTAVWAIKKRLWKCYGPGKLLIYKGNAARPVLDETLIPKGEAE